MVTLYHGFQPVILLETPLLAKNGIPFVFLSQKIGAHFTYLLTVSLVFITCSANIKIEMIRL